MKIELTLTNYAWSLRKEREKQIEIKRRERGEQLHKLTLPLAYSKWLKVKRSGSIHLKKKISDTEGKQRERRITREKATGDKMRQ